MILGAVGSSANSMLLVGNMISQSCLQTGLWQQAVIWQSTGATCHRTMAIGPSSVPSFVVTWTIDGCGG
jgi:hypothetical protein